MFRGPQYIWWLTLTLLLSGISPLHAQTESVKVGMLVLNDSYKASMQAAELAVDQANQHRGYKGMPFELVLRTTEGPWGAGSKESVNLIYEDDVRAILCSLDGRNAHLAEQVAAKTHTACLSTRATDPTLTQAYVPWFIRCVPNDDQQSSAILDLIHLDGRGKTAILANEQNDTQLTVQSLTRISDQKGYESPLIIQIRPDQPFNQQLIDQIIGSNFNHLIVPFHTTLSLKIIEELRKHNPDIRIYGTHSFSAGINPKNQPWETYEGMILISAHVLFTPRGKEFLDDFASKYGYTPGISACYSFDGMNLIIKAIKKVGLDREDISAYINEIKEPDGITGSISFDELGNRSDPVRFMRVKEGIPQKMN